MAFVVEDGELACDGVQGDGREVLGDEVSLPLLEGEVRR
jgi:hypothetical protein